MKVETIRDKSLQTNTYLVTREDGQQAHVWYDPSQRLWTSFLVDGDGHQMGDTAYDTSKADAIEGTSALDPYFWLRS